jgi:hypothetical protein
LRGEKNHSKVSLPTGAAIVLCRSLGALVQLKGIFTQKVLLVPGSQRHANLLAHN